MTKQELDKIIVLRNMKKIEVAITDLGYVDSKTFPEAGATSIVKIVRSEENIVAKTYRRRLTEYDATATTKPINGFLFVMVEVNKIRLDRMASLPFTAKIYAKKVEE